MQESEPIELTQGQRYSLRTHHEEGGGSDYFRVAVRYNGTTLSPLEKLHESVRERQIISFRTTVTREVQTITFRNVSGGSFLLSYDSKFSGSVAFGSTNQVRRCSISRSAINSLG